MRFLLLLSLFSPVISLKFLAYSPQFATSHMNFMARITDSLVDTGHEVVMLAPIVDSTVKGPGTTKARIISLPRADKSDVIERLMNEILVEQVWTYQSTTELFTDWKVMMEAWQDRCNATVRFPGLIDQSREEKFDVAFGEILDFCMPGIFHLIGIDKWAVTDSLAMNDGHFFYTHTPTNPAYVPGLMSAEGGESMTFLQRLTNFFIIQLSALGRIQFAPLFQDVFAQIDPNFPDLEEIAGNNSLVFVNSEPLVDFPRPSSARMIDIGGIAVSNAPHPLNQTWSAILDRRPKNVIISFGSFAKAYLMPTHYKQTLIETMKKFSDVTFIWKYETTPVSRHSSLIVDREAPLKRIMLAYLPLVVIPVAFDQLRNAEQMRRMGVGIVMERKDLAKEGRFEEAIREIIENHSYKEKARKLKESLLDRPFTMNEKRE